MTQTCRDKFLITFLYAALLTIPLTSPLPAQVASLVQGVRATDYHDVRFDGYSLSSGVYFYRLEVRPVKGGQSGEFAKMRKLLLQ